MKKLVALVVFLTFVLTGTGCSFKDSDKYELYTWQALAVAATTYNETMTALGNLHTAGKVSDETAYKAIELGKKFTPLYKAAVSSLKVFVLNPTEDAGTAVKNTLTAALTSLDYLVEFAKTFGVDKKSDAEAVVNTENAEVIATTAADTFGG